MATLKQRKVARVIIDTLKQDSPMTGGQVLEKVGYSKNLQKQSGRVIQSVGVKEELAYLGFTTEGADSVVEKILYKGKRDENKLKAADMVYKRFGSYKDTEQGAGKTLIIQITSESAERYGVTPKPETSST